MNKIAFVFPGQGAQKVGMGKDFFEQYDIAKKLFKQADEALGYSIMNMCFEGPETDLRLTANTQPAILTMSVIANEILKEHGLQPDIVGGHSLGEYSALVAADVLDFQDAVLLVHKRGAFMQEAVPVGEGGMAAIIGLDRAKIVEICEQASAEVSAVQAVNFNCPGQIVIAGTTCMSERDANTIIHPMMTYVTADTALILLPITAYIAMPSTASPQMTPISVQPSGP